MSRRKWIAAAAAASAVLIACVMLAGASSGLCPECGSTEYEMVDMVRETCTSSGIASYRCTEADCGYEWDEPVPGLEALGHSFGGWATQKEATCTEAGSRQRTCTRSGCGFTETEKTDKASHNLEEREHRDADCTSGGIKPSWECTQCGSLFEDAEGMRQTTEQELATEPLGHRWKAVETDATCTEDGAVRQICTECGAEGTKSAGQKALGHNMKFEEGTPAGCTADGVRSVYVCTRCSGRFLDENGTQTALGQDTISAPGHKLKHTAAAAASCTAGGTREHWTCEECGLIFADGFGASQMTGNTATPPAGHPLEAVSGKDASCTTAGSSEYWKCTECGKLFADEKAAEEISFEDTAVPAEGHSLEHYPKKDASENEPGHTEHWKCTRCGRLFADSDGSYELQLDDVYQEPAGHSIVPASGKDPTCTEPGAKAHFVCQGCGAKFADADGTNPVSDADIAIKPAGHSYEDTVTEPDCENDGFTTHVCTACGDSRTDSRTEPAGHTLRHTEQKPASHDEPGQKEHWTCTKCGKIFEDMNGSVPAGGLSIPASGHRYEQTVVEPTCTEGGYTEHVCTECGDSYRDSETDPTGHVNLIHAEEEPATTDEPGTKEHWKCEDCGLVFLDEQGLKQADPDDLIVPPLGHNCEEEVVAPTCTEGGYTIYTCTDVDCSFTYTDHETDALGHDLTRFPAQEPTLTRDGNIEYWRCSRCGEYFTDADGTNAADADSVVRPKLEPAPGGGTAAATGDTRSIALYGWIAAAAAACSIAAIILMRRRKC